MLRDLLLILFWAGFSIPAAADPTDDLLCHGKAIQGGLLICSAPAGSTLVASSAASTREIPVDATGIATIGLQQAEAEEISLSVTGTDIPPLTLPIAPREDPYRVIDGFDCDKVDARTPEQIEHAGQSWVKKRDAFETFSLGRGALDGFVPPAEGQMSSPFGPTRKYIGVGKDGKACEKVSVHQGYDLAVPVGTEIVAPAAGTVILGDPDLYYEGGTVFLDHGAGLVSVFMHMSEVDVVAGQAVQQGERLGASGNTGRTTGPHLHWAVKWRNPGSEDRGDDFYIDPALLLELEPAP